MPPFFPCQALFHYCLWTEHLVSLLIIKQNILLLGLKWESVTLLFIFFLLHCLSRCTVISKCSLRSPILYLVTIWQNLAHYTSMRSFGRAGTLYGDLWLSCLFLICSSQELFCCFSFLSHKYFECHSISGEIICSIVLNSGVTVSAWFIGLASEIVLSFGRCVSLPATESTHTSLGA